MHRLAAYLASPRSRRSPSFKRQPYASMQADVKQQTHPPAERSFSKRTTEWRPDRSARSELCPMLSAPVGCASHQQPEVSARGAAYEHSRQRRRRRRRYLRSARASVTRPSACRRRDPRPPTSTTRLSLSSATVLPQWSAVGSQVDELAALILGRIRVAAPSRGGAEVDRRLPRC